MEDWVASIYLAGGSKPGDIYLQYMKSNPATLQKLKNFVNQNKDIYPDKYPFEDFALFVGIINRFLEQRVFNGIDRLYTHLEQVVRAMNMVEATMMTEKRSNWHPFGLSYYFDSTTNYICSPTSKTNMARSHVSSYILQSPVSKREERQDERISD